MWELTVTTFGRLVGESVRGKNTMYESGSKAVGGLSTMGRDPGQDIGLTIFQAVKLDIELASKAAATRKAAGETLKFDLSGERSQRAAKSLEEATKASNLK